jgi:hypothetical protein
LVFLTPYWVVLRVDRSCCVSVFLLTCDYLFFRRLGLFLGHADFFGLSQTPGAPQKSQKSVQKLVSSRTLGLTGKQTARTGSVQTARSSNFLERWSGFRI